MGTDVEIKRNETGKKCRVAGFFLGAAMIGYGIFILVTTNGNEDILYDVSLQTTVSNAGLIIKVGLLVWTVVMGWAVLSRLKDGEGYEMIDKAPRARHWHSLVWAIIGLVIAGLGLYLASDFGLAVFILGLIVSFVSLLSWALRPSHKPER